VPEPDEFKTVAEIAALQQILAPVVGQPGGRVSASMFGDARHAADAKRSLSSRRTCGNRAATRSVSACSLKDPDEAIFNLHCPPYGTSVDVAPKLDADLKPVLDGGNPVTASAGSKANRAVIECSQALLGLHGHAHESSAEARADNVL
jgi:hypothetical protein